MRNLAKWGLIISYKGLRGSLDTCYGDESPKQELRHPLGKAPVGEQEAGAWLGQPRGHCRGQVSAPGMAPIMPRPPTVPATEEAWLNMPMATFWTGGRWGPFKWPWEVPWLIVAFIDPEPMSGGGPLSRAWPAPTPLGTAMLLPPPLNWLSLPSPCDVPYPFPLL